MNPKIVLIGEKAILSVATFFVLFLSTACQSAPENPTSFLNLKGSKSISFDGLGGTNLIAFSTNQEWFITSSESWCSVSPSFGKAGQIDYEIALSCEPNVSYNERSCIVNIVAGDYNEKLHIFQKAGDCLSVSPDSFYLSSEQQCFEIKVSRNVSYSVIIDDSCTDWISMMETKATTDDTILFRVEENASYDSREGIIRISQINGGLTTTVIVSQAQKDAIIINGENHYVLSEEEHILNISINSNIEYEFHSDVDWIRTQTTKATEDSVVSLCVSKNESTSCRRTAVIFRSLDGSTFATVQIDQQANPRLTSVAPSDIGCNSARINGCLTVESISEVTQEVWFLFGEGEKSIEELIETGSLIKGSMDENGSISAIVDGLVFCTTYSFVACAKVYDRTYYGDVECFSTSDIYATIVTCPATEIRALNARLNMTLTIENEESLNTSICFLYSDTETTLESLVKNGHKVDCDYIGSDCNSTFFPEELRYSTTYYYVACARIEEKVFYGEVMSFTTEALSLTLVDNVASDIRSFSSTITARIKAEDGVAKKCTTWVYYSTEDTVLEALKTRGAKKDGDVTEDGVITLRLDKLKSSTTYYYVIVTAVFDLVFFDGSIRSFTTESIPEGAVDLGLSVAWATKNLSSGNWSDFFAWGEVEPKELYSWSTYKWCEDGKQTRLTKYNTLTGRGILDNKTILELEDDAAHEKLGGRWRIPTRDEYIELLANCTWTIKFMSGGIVCLVTSKINGNSIEFPLHGRKSETGFQFQYTYGYYFSSSLDVESPSRAHFLYIENTNVSQSVVMSMADRGLGCSIRPVTD